MSNSIGKAGGKAGCAICGKPVEAGFRPFCSRRCADVDLSRWLGGVYRIETEDDPEKNVEGDEK